MPAHIGIFGRLKVPLATLYQFTPTEGGAQMRSTGLVNPAEIWRSQVKDTSSRDKFVNTYNKYRQWLDKFDPAMAKKKRTNGDDQTRMTPVDALEWDHYLKAGTVFDTAIKTVLDRNEGWRVDFVSRKSDRHALKRIEIKQGKGHMSITLWSHDGSANERLF